VIAATEENAAVVRERLGQDAAAAVAGEIGNARDMGEPELLAELTRIAEQLDMAREAELLERRAAQIGRGERVEALDDVLAAVSDARVETLLIARGAQVEVFSCPQCGRLSDHAQVCPIDGNFMQDDGDGVEAPVGETISRGGDVWELLDVDRRDLAAGGGLGAILRF
jgi:peptide subunit release factor 1 (eRF1)